MPLRRLSALDQAGGPLAFLGLAWLVGAARWLRSRRLAWLALPLASELMAAALFWLFRNPERRPPQDRRLILAAADGQVTDVVPLTEERFLHGPAIRIDVAISWSEVQVNRAPLGGVARYRRYELGRQPGGAPPTQSSAQDRNWLGIEQSTGARVLLCQVASSIWQRAPRLLGRPITCWPDLEESVQAGQVIGRLPLGERVEVYVAGDAELAVEPGRRVRAGETVLAVLKET